MTPHVAEIWRHPIKSIGREALARVLLSEGRTMPWDRRWALLHEAAVAERGVDAEPEWLPCQNFNRVAQAPRLQAVTARVNLRFGKVTLSHPDLTELTIEPDDPGAATTLIQWVLPLLPANRPLPADLIRTKLRGMTDTDYPSISLVNLASHAEVASRIGAPTSHLRWRANLVLGGIAPWTERGWIGRKIRVGMAELEVREQITRCKATTASTRTGERDRDTLGALQSGWGHQEFGVYAVVTKSGDLRQGDAVEVLG